MEGPERFTKSKRVAGAASLAAIGIGTFGLFRCADVACHEKATAIITAPHDQLVHGTEGDRSVRTWTTGYSVGASVTPERALPITFPVTPGP